MAWSPGLTSTSVPTAHEKRWLLLEVPSEAVTVTAYGVVLAPELIVPEIRPVDELMLLSQMLSGHKGDQIGGGLPLENEALQIAWRKLSAQYPSDFTVSQQETVAWHQREAEAAAEAGQWSAAVFHWSQLIQVKPDDQTFRDRCAAAQKRLGSERTRRTE